MLIATVLAAALLAIGPQEAPGARYAMELAVTHDGVTTLSTHSVIVEDGTASISVIDSERVFEMNATLVPVQGDGDGERLYLSISINDGDAEPLEPRLLFERGDRARVAMGETDETGRIIDGVTVDISPMQSPSSQDD